MFSFVCVISDFVYQYLIVSEYWSSASLGRSIPRYFILFDVLVSGIVSLMSISDLSLLVYKNARDFFCVCVRRTRCCIYSFWLHWVFMAARGLCVIAESRGCSLLQRAGDSCGGFPCGAWALGVWASVVAVCRLVAACWPESMGLH